MRLRNHFLVTVLVLLLAPPIIAAPSDSKDKSKPAETAPESALKQGMSAATVKQLMGTPLEVRPMATPNGKAEVWVFTRQMGTRVERLGFPSAEIITYVMGADGKPREQRTPGPVQYQNVLHIIEESCELLMFNDEYVTHKTYRRERRAQ